MDQIILNSLDLELDSVRLVDSAWQETSATDIVLDSKMFAFKGAVINKLKGFYCSKYVRWVFLSWILGFGWILLLAALMERNNTMVWPILSPQARRIINYIYTSLILIRKILYPQIPGVHFLAGMSLLSKLLLIFHWLCSKIVGFFATW